MVIPLFRIEEQIPVMKKTGYTAKKRFRNGIGATKTIFI
jgi:hypothetical protein